VVVVVGLLVAGLVLALGAGLVFALGAASGTSVFGATTFDGGGTAPYAGMAIGVVTSEGVADGVGATVVFGSLHAARPSVAPRNIAAREARITGALGAATSSSDEQNGHTDSSPRT
jgi:hypothetical protein